MKKDVSYLISGLILFGFGVLMMVGIIVWGIPLVPNWGSLTIFLLCWVLHLFGFGSIIRYFQKPKLNFSWNKIKDKQEFIVMAISERFEKTDQGGNGKITINLDRLGAAVVDFPKNNMFWKGTEGPMKGGNYMKVDNYFIKI